MTLSSFFADEPLTGVLPLLICSPAAAARRLSSASLSFTFLASSSSFCLSYPNRLIRSSSSIALRWASSKLIPPTAFFAPSLDDLGAAGAVVEDDSRDETAGRVDPAAPPLPTPPAPPARSEDDVTVREAGFAPIEGGGVAGLEPGLDADDGVLGFSLSHVLKKSSAGSAGVDEPRGVSSRPSIWIPWGFLP